VNGLHSGPRVHKNIYEFQVSNFNAKV